MTLRPTLFLIFTLFLNSLLSAQETAGNPDSLQVSEIQPELSLPDFQLQAVNGKVYISYGTDTGKATISINGEDKEAMFVDGKAELDIEISHSGKLLLLKAKNSSHKLIHVAKTKDAGFRIRPIPFWLSVLPPAIAILLALIFKEVIASLFAGVWVGAFIAGGLRVDSIYYFLESLLGTVQRYVVNALTDTGHISVVIFSLLIGGMVAIISRNGGMAGVVLSLSKYAKSPRSSQFVSWLLGVAIFFDDYANTLIVGNTMRPVTDRFRISREKLAYIVDSTAAPVAAIAFITTWIGAELGYIDSGIVGLKDFPEELTPYSIFLSSLKYSFYPVLTLIFLLMVIYSRREIGPMYKAEFRARSTGQVAPENTNKIQSSERDHFNPVEGATLKWYNAAIPVFFVIFMTIFGLVDTGMTSAYNEIVSMGHAVASPSWSDVWSNIGLLAGENTGFLLKLGKLIGMADSYVALLWASLTGVLAATLLTLWARIMSLTETMDSLITGFKAMMPAVVILTLAWSLASSTLELNTATFLATSLKDTISPHTIPVVVFIFAALISFSTGSSWSTMAILYPIAIPTTWAISHAAGLDDFNSMEILLNVIAVVLGASVMGDHCSPISDTTILSSLASDCNHIDHVRTQLPYALAVGGVSIILCYLSTWFEGGWGLSIGLMLTGILILALILWKFGKKLPPDDPETFAV